MSHLHHGAPGEVTLLTDEEFRQVRELLYDRAGLYFADHKRFLLENRIHRRLKALGLAAAADYLRLIRGPGRGSAELMEFLDAVTTHETSFFRNGSQLDAFRSQVLPRLLAAQAARGVRTLRVWSAACSSGEEPYTLAMLLLEALGDETSRWRIQILGTDIAKSVLEKARAAVYTRYSFRTTPAYFAQKYFDVEGPDAYRLREEPRRLVEFQLLNFADEARMRLVRGFQVIFCRNALIYFDRDAKARFVGHFARAIEPGGFFFVGHSESLHGVSEDFKLVHFAGALAYQKPASDPREGGMP